MAQATRPSQPWPRRYRWTNEEVCKLGDAGYFSGRSVILVDGVILEIPLATPAHDAILNLLDYMLKEIFRSGYAVRVQSGLNISIDTNPLPDLAVVTGSPKDYITHQPKSALLIVEVSNTSFAYDSGEKSNLYAAAGIIDYWVLDLNDRQLFVFREPIADSEAPRGYRYASIQTLTTADAITPLAAPEASIRVADMLP